MTSEPLRPDPDALLAAIHADEAKAARAGDTFLRRR